MNIFKSNNKLEELEKIYNIPDDVNKHMLFFTVQDTVTSSPFYLNKPTETRAKMEFACLILDTHWDPIKKESMLHTALGGCGNPRLGVFGSHLLHAWPENLNELVNRLTDSRKIDFQQLADDSSATKFEAFNTGIGALLHEIGHAFSLGIN